MAEVFLTDMRTTPGNNILDKFEKLLLAGGLDKIDFRNKFVALKIHFGEPGNLAYIRPNYIHVITEIIKKKGGRPFLTDTNTLYTGRRANAVDHLVSAEKNGFTYSVTDVPVIIADGLKGTDYTDVEVNFQHIKKAKIGTVIADCDIVISVSHFKGHEMTGFGGALKNLGMGCGSRGGKLEMHSSSKPVIKEDKCVSCGMCIKGCAQSAIAFNSRKKAAIDYDLCTGCGQCVAVCMYKAALFKWDENIKIACEKMAEYAYAALKDKKHFHISFITDVSPDCDCFSNNDMPVVPNIGIAASSDPVALDKACVDLVNSSKHICGSVLDERGYKEGDDVFTKIHPETDWRYTVNHAAEIGLGSSKYKLTKI